MPDIAGFELAESYDDDVRRPGGLPDQRVLILGKGNSAFETADNLIETTTVIHVAGRARCGWPGSTHYVGHLRAVNNNFLDTYQLKSAERGARLRPSERIERDGDGYSW